MRDLQILHEGKSDREGCILKKGNNVGVIMATIKSVKNNIDIRSNLKSESYHYFQLTLIL